MNLLLVDDEEYVVRSIMKHVDWEACGIEEVYTASSMKQAVKIMELVPVDVIICDIVMPEESGFDFIEWVRGQKFEVQVIFLTSYAQFDYARRAISLNSVDYLLKPIDYPKLQQAVATARERACEARNYENFRSQSRHWRQNQILLQRDFWAELLRGDIPAGDLAGEAQRRQLNCRQEDTFFILYFSFHDGKKSAELWDEKTLNFVLRNVLAELLADLKIRVEAVITEGRGSYIAVCGKEDGCTCDEEELKNREVFEQFTRWMEEKIRMDVWCGVGTIGRADTLQASLALVRGMRDNTLSVWHRVLYLSDFEHPKSAYQNSRLDVWNALLAQGKEQELIVDMEDYLEEMESSEMITREILKAFRMDITQMVYSWLSEREIKAHLLFSGKEDESVYQNALQGMYGAKAYLRSLVTQALRYESYINKTESVTEQIRQYIDQHYREDIRRDDLGEMVYLNTDYMSRIFKKETGISISSYIIGKRVEEAKKLLAQSSLPINSVSISVGYSNFSYFTKMFRENTEYSPLEYRRKYKKQKRDGGEPQNVL